MSIGPTKRPQPRPIKRLLQAVADAHARHKDRHRPTGYGFVHADRIGYLDAGQWDQVTNTASIFLQRDYLQVIEEYGPENLTPRYALIFRDQKPVAAVAAQIVAISAGQITKKPALPGLKEHCLVCGNLLSWGPHGVAFAPGETPGTLWPAVAEALYRIRRAERLAGQTDFVMVKDLPAGLDQDVLKRYSYRPVETEPNMVLELPHEWRTYDDYLASLQSSYRKAAKRAQSDLSEAGCQEELLSDLGEHADSIHGLYLKVHERAEVRPVTLDATFIPALASAMGARFRCTVIRKDSSLLGFTTTLKDGDTAICYYIGFDREANTTLPVYHRLLQINVADGIALGCRRLSLGRTALEAKARLGAKPVPFQVWIRHRTPLVNLFVRSLLQHVQHAEPPDRNPFKR